jgi:hypothetical protein
MVNRRYRTNCHSGTVFSWIGAILPSFCFFWPILGVEWPCGPRVQYSFLRPSPLVFLCKCICLKTGSAPVDTSPRALLVDDEVGPHYRFYSRADRPYLLSEKSPRRIHPIASRPIPVDQSLAYSKEKNVYAPWQIFTLRIPSFILRSKANNYF